MHAISRIGEECFEKLGGACPGPPVLALFDCLSLKTIRGRKTNKHKQLRGIVPEMGGGQIVYVFPLFLGNT